MASQSESHSTPEVLAFKKHYGRLVEVIVDSDLPILGAKFYSEDIISRDTKEHAMNQATTRAVKSATLISAVMSHLNVNPMKFECVLSIISQQPTLKIIAAGIAKTHEQIASSKVDIPSSESDLKHAPAKKPRLAGADTSTSAVERYCEYLRMLYLRSKLPIKGKWPPSFCKKIINLAVVEKLDEKVAREQQLCSTSLNEYITHSNASLIEFKDFLTMDDGSQPRCVIVQGAPGIGKSTFSWKVCRKWGKGKLFQEYALVILLRMRDKYVREAKSLSDLFRSPDPMLSHDVTEEVVRKRGKGVLFILEGIDELPISVLSDEDSVLMELLQGILLPEVTVVVTSRPWAVQTLLEKYSEQISRHIEILGFRKEDISCYVQNAFSSELQAKEFHQYIDTQPNLQSVMHVPLNVAIIIEVYKQRERSNRPLPRTMTQLYTTLVQSLILRHMNSLPDHAVATIEDLHSLPEPFKGNFHKVCSLAYTGFTKPSIQVVFSEEDLPSQVDSLGLVQSSGELCVDTGSSITHSFLHITVQEFLTAYHVFLQPPDVVSKFISDHLESPLFFVVLCYLAGLTQLSKSIWSPFLDINITAIHDTRYFHWLYEAQIPTICNEMFHQKVMNMTHKHSASFRTIVFIRSGIKFMTYPVVVSSFDIYALCYCIQHSTSRWNLSIAPHPSILKDIHPQYTMSSSDTIKSGCIESICVFSNWTSAELLLTFLSIFPKCLFNGISSLTIWSDQSALLADNSLETSPLSNKSVVEYLEDICIHGINLGDGGSAPFFEAIHTSNKIVTSIELYKTNIGNKDTLLLCKLLTKMNSFTKLVLQSNHFQSEVLQQLFSGLACAAALTTLDISYNAMTTEDVELMSVAVSENKTLKSLRMYRCSINAEGVSYLAEELAKNIYLEILDLGGNQVDKTGTQALADMLCENKHLEVLNLVPDNSIQTSGAETLMLALSSNQTLQTLFLDEECKPCDLKLQLLYQSGIIHNRTKFVTEDSDTVRFLKLSGKW